MSANKIAETSTSTGTGDFTLSGAWNIVDSFNTGNLTFNSYYGLNHVFPYMIQDKLGNWEKGEGYLSASTTLVRLNVYNTSANSTTKINFPAGDKIVCVPTDARAFGSGMLNKATYSLTGQAVGARGSLTLAANTIYISPHLIIAPCRITTIAYRVAAQSAGSTMRVGIYNLTKQSDTGNDYDSAFPLMVDLGTVDTGTTGVKPIICDIKLGQGVYGFAVISSGTPQIMATGTNILWTGCAANTFDNNPISFWSVSNGTALASGLPANTPNAMTAIMNQSSPCALLKGGIL